jgi:hypothetical protein
MVSNEKDLYQVYNGAINTKNGNKNGNRQCRFQFYNSANNKNIDSTAMLLSMFNKLILHYNLHDKLHDKKFHYFLSDMSVIMSDKHNN